MFTLCPIFSLPLYHVATGLRTIQFLSTIAPIFIFLFLPVARKLLKTFGQFFDTFDNFLTIFFNTFLHFLIFLTTFSQLFHNLLTSF
jgi:hypothetical protein